MLLFGNESSHSATQNSKIRKNVYHVVFGFFRKSLSTGGDTGHGNGLINLEGMRLPPAVAGSTSCTSSFFCNVFRCSLGVETSSAAWRRLRWSSSCTACSSVRASSLVVAARKQMWTCWSHRRSGRPLLTSPRGGGSNQSKRKKMRTCWSHRRSGRPLPTSLLELRSRFLLELRSRFLLQHQPALHLDRRRREGERS